MPCSTSVSPGGSEATTRSLLVSSVNTFAMRPARRPEPSRRSWAWRAVTPSRSGTLVPCAPRLTTAEILRPRFTTPPAAGSCETTKPRGTSGLHCSEILDSLSPSAASMRSASTSLWPVISGTWTSAPCRVKLGMSTRFITRNPPSSATPARMSVPDQNEKRGPRRRSDGGGAGGSATGAGGSFTGSCTPISAESLTVSENGRRRRRRSRSAAASRRSRARPRETRREGTDRLPPS